MFKQKIEFGLGLNYGTIIAKQVDLRIELKDDEIFHGKKKIILEFLMSSAKLSIQRKKFI